MRREKEGGKPNEIVRNLQILQSQQLRIITGAYKTIPIRNLKTEIYILPLDIYLNKRLADFELRLKRTGKVGLIRNVYATIKYRLYIRKCPQRQRIRQPPPETGKEKVSWTR